jgi:hypothetical protein
LLVANQDVEKLSEAMKFVEDENLYRYCKKMRCSNLFRFPTIGKQWLDVMNISLK